MKLSLSLLSLVFALSVRGATVVVTNSDFTQLPLSGRDVLESLSPPHAQLVANAVQGVCTFSNVQAATYKLILQRRPLASLVFTPLAIPDTTNTVNAYEVWTGTYGAPPSTPLTTDYVPEGYTNWYWTTARSNALYNAARSGILSSNGVTSFNARYGDVTLSYQDVIDALTYYPGTNETKIPQIWTNNDTFIWLSGQPEPNQFRSPNGPSFVIDMHNGAITVGSNVPPIAGYDTSYAGAHDETFYSWRNSENDNFNELMIGGGTTNWWWVDIWGDSVNYAHVELQDMVNKLSLSLDGGPSLTGTHSGSEVWKITTNGTIIATFVGDGHGLTNLDLQAAQTQFPYTAITNAPWGLPQTNISYTAITNAPWLSTLNATGLVGKVQVANLGYSGSANANNFLNGAGNWAPPASTHMVGQVCLTDLGAVGDGVTDNTDVIAGALALGTNIYVPPGVFLCGSLTTTVSQHWTFAAGSTILYNTNRSGYYMLMFNGPGNSVEGPAWFNANLCNYRTNGSGVVYTNSAFWSFHGYLSSPSTNNGLYVNPEGNSRITDLNFCGWTGRALTIQGTQPDENIQVEHYFVRNCYFTNNCIAIALALTVNGAEYGIVMGNKGYWNDCFIEQRCANVEIVGNSCNYANEGYWLHPPLDTNMGSQGRGHNNVVGNTFNHCGYAYYIDNANTGVNITANNFLGCVQANAVEGTSTMQVNDNYFELADQGMWDTSTNAWASYNIYRNNTIAQAFGYQGTNLFTGFTNKYIWYGNVLSGGHYANLTNNTFIRPTTGTNLFTGSNL
jgi:hypothetical protein